MTLWRDWMAVIPSLVGADGVDRKPPHVEDKPNPFNQVRQQGIVVVGGIVHAMAEVVSNDSERWGPIGEFPAHKWLELKNVSAHAFICPDGTITAAVAIELVAFHAGHSRWDGLMDGLPSESLNYNTLGAEWLVEGVHGYGSFLERISDPECYTDEQYDAGGWLYASWESVCPHFEAGNLLTHSAVAGDDVRGEGKGKRDPGPGFNWPRFKESFNDWSETLKR